MVEDIKWQVELFLEKHKLLMTGVNVNGRIFDSWHVYQILSLQKFCFDTIVSFSCKVLSDFVLQFSKHLK